MNKPKPSNVPIYAAIYPELASIAREHGYALAVHGSMQRDFDVVGIPWVENPSPPAEVVRAISNRWSSSSLPVGVPSPMWHGREAWTITLGMFGDCFIDLSFMPCSPQGIDEARRRALVCCFCGQQCRSLESLKNHSANCEKHPMYEAATAWRSVCRWVDQDESRSVEIFSGNADFSGPAYAIEAKGAADMDDAERLYGETREELTQRLPGIET